MRIRLLSYSLLGLVLALVLGACDNSISVGALCVTTPGASAEQQAAELNQCVHTIYDEYIEADMTIYGEGSGLCPLITQCLSSLPKVVDGVPQCIVSYVGASQLLPRCSEGCCQAFANSDDLNSCRPYRGSAVIAACNPEPTDCYCIVRHDLYCRGSAEPDVWQTGNTPPPSNFIRFRCAGTSPTLPLQ